MMVSLTFAPDIGFGLGTIPGDILKPGRVPVPHEVLGEQRMYAEDWSYEEIKKGAKFPASATNYPEETINMSFGYVPEDYVLSIKSNGMYILKDNAKPHVIPKYSMLRDNRQCTISCTEVVQ